MKKICRRAARRPLGQEGEREKPEGGQIGQMGQMRDILPFLLIESTKHTLNLRMCWVE